MPITPHLLQSVTSTPAARLGRHRHPPAGRVLRSRPRDGCRGRGRWRDRGLEELDNVLSGSAWDLWPHFEASVQKRARGSSSSGTATQVARPSSSSTACRCGSAVAARTGARPGLQATPAGGAWAELPGETTPFANSLGFGHARPGEQRGWFRPQADRGVHCLLQFALERLHRARWSARRIRVLAPLAGRTHARPVGAGRGLAQAGEGSVCRPVRRRFLVVRRAAGHRARLVITSDHGYAACGDFPDLGGKDQVTYMTAVFKNGRSAAATASTAPGCRPSTWP